MVVSPALQLTFEIIGAVIMVPAVEEHRGQIGRSQND
jgi:hypothetical protein